MSHSNKNDIVGKDGLVSCAAKGSGMVGLGCVIVYGRFTLTAELYRKCFSKKR